MLLKAIKPKLLLNAISVWFYNYLVTQNFMKLRDFS